MPNIPFFDLTRQHHYLARELQSAYEKVMRGSLYILGEEVEKFEHAFADYLGVPHCISCGNGTDALELALEAGGIGPGDEVIVPANTWVSVAEAVVRVGAVPVFADGLQNEYTIDPQSVRRCVSPHTAAIIVVHQYGIPARMEELLTIGNQHNLLVVEDCAHAHGATYNGQKVGSLGDFGCFSFYPTKNLGCLGDGGAVVTKSEEWARKLRLVANHGQSARNQHEAVGRNSRLDELQAAFLNVKLPHLDRWNERRKQIADFYKQRLAGHFQVPHIVEGACHVFHQFVIQVENREALIDRLLKKGIQTAIHYPELIPNLKPYTRYRHDPAGLAVAEAAKNRILSLPVFPELTEDELEAVVEILLTTPR